MSRKALQRAIRSCESQAEFAAKLGISSPSISEWLRRGVPRDRCVDIEHVSGVPCEQLCDEVEWHRDAQGRVTGYFVRVERSSKVA